MKFLKKVWEDVTEWAKEADRKTILLGVLIFLASALLLGTLIRFLVENISASLLGEGWHFRASPHPAGTRWVRAGTSGPDC